MKQKEYLQRLKGKAIKYRDTLNLDNNITFGLEIEYENIFNSNMSYFLNDILELKDWVNDQETDIMEYYQNEMMNGEVKTPPLTDTKKTWEDLRSVLMLMKNNNGFVTSWCGGHVNIGAHIFENIEDYYRNFILLWTLYKTEINYFSSGEFKKIRVKEKGIIDGISKEVKRYLIDIAYNFEIPYFDKNHEVSFEKATEAFYEKNNVIEIRLPNGTLNEEIWQNYVNFFTKFLLKCKEDIDIDKIVYKIEKDEHDIFELADFVFTDDLDKDNFLIQSLKLNKIYNKSLVAHKIYE